MNSYKLTILTDNNAAPGLRAEHGFSALLSLGDKQLVFDCGKTGTALDNGRLMGIDFGPHTVVVSHNHYDHADGLVSFAGLPGHFRLYLSRDFECMERFWIDGETGERHDTKSAVTEELIASWKNVTPIWTEKGVTPVEGFQSLFILSGFEHSAEEPVDQSNFRNDGEGKYTDDYRDEIVLVVRGTDGLTVISGCAHCGSIGICKTAEALLGLPVKSFFGGTHLFAFDEERAKATAGYFEKSSVRLLGACHCTGETGAKALSGLKAYKSIFAGYTAEIPFE